MKPLDTLENGDERARQAALDEHDILDTAPEAAFDDLVELARMVCDAPVAAVSLVDGDRQWFKAEYGLAFSEMPRSASICSLAIEAPDDVFVAHDVLNALGLSHQVRDAEGRALRFYAAAPLRTSDGFALGTLCVLDHEPRELSAAQRSSLLALARQAQHVLELRRVAHLQRMQLQQRARDCASLEDECADLQRRHDDLSLKVDRDPLTGLLNRGALDRLRARPDAMQRLNAATYTLMLVDIDRFKQINDQHGHLLGDRALRAVAQAISGCIRESDIAVRYGGDEFLVVLPSTPTDRAFEVADRIRVACGELPLPFTLGVSIGLASGDPQRDQPEQVFERADQSLYRAKSQGRNCVVADDSLRS